MARGGINKAVVQKARQALVAKGLYPSIDAVRVELGNTGSKTTISRYLKEIEAHDPAPVSSQARLSDELTSLVQGLLTRLQDEGQAAVTQASAEFETRYAALQAEAGALQAQLSTAHREVATQHAALQSQTEQLLTSQSSLQAELTRNAGLSQQCVEMQARLQDKDQQIQSLEEKHVHARGALEHYRESVKDQREQDQRRHEAQLQQLQVEQRQLQQTLVVKQDELTRLNRDNERLLGEARQQAKVLDKQDDALQRLEHEVQALKGATAKAEGIHEQLREQVSALKLEVLAAAAQMRQADGRVHELEGVLRASEVENQRLQALVEDGEQPSLEGPE